MAKRKSSPRAKAVAFFHKHAGYSWDPKKETHEQGRRRCARELADAEQTAAARGWRVEWEHDELPYEMGDAETEMPSVCACCAVWLKRSASYSETARWTSM